MIFFLFFRLYLFLENDKIIETYEPSYPRPKFEHSHIHRPTAALLMKDTELNRIVDDDERFQQKVDRLLDHYNQSRQEKAGLGTNPY